MASKRKATPSVADLFNKRKVDDNQSTSTASESSTNEAEIQKSVECSVEKRNVKSIWFVKYKWLKFDVYSKMFFCRDCVDSGRRNVFTTGKSSSKPKADDFNKHEFTTDHKFATVAKCSVEAEELPKTVTKMYNTIKDSIIATIKNVYFAVKEDLPKEKIAALNAHCAIQGCDALKVLSKDQLLSYTSHCAVDDFIDSIAATVEQLSLDPVRSSKFYALQFDESIDISVIQNIIIYIRTVQSGKVENTFLTLASLDEGCKAEAIHTKILNVLQEKKIPLDSLIGLATDGASVMVGKQSGVVTRFKQKNPFIISTHCASHKLALASGQSANSIPFLVKYQDMLNSIYKYFHCSPKCQRSLSETQTLLGEKQLKFKHLSSTRWLSFHSSVQTTVESLGSLITTLTSDATEHKANGRAAGLVKTVAKYDFIATSHFLLDVLTVLNKLCLLLQSRDLNYSEMLKLIDSAKQSLELYTDPNYKGLHLTRFEEILNVEESLKCGSFEFKSHKVQINKKQMDTFNKMRTCFIDNLIKKLGERFDGDDQILRSFQILNPSSLSDTEMACYGNEEITILAEHFGEDKLDVSAPLEKDAILEDWATFKLIMLQHKNLSYSDFWKLALQKYSEAFPAICALGSIYMTLPPTSVESERGFSKQNIIKPSLRNNLSTTSVSKLILIKSEGPEIGDFNFEKAFQDWCSRKDRKIFLPSFKQKIASNLA